MKKRVISAVVLLIICAPPLLMGGLLLKILCALVAASVCYEFSKIRHKRFNAVLYISMLVFVLLFNVLPHRKVGLLILYLICLFFLAIISEEISLDDISSVFMMATIVAYAVNALLDIYHIGNGYMIMLYILIASFGCDIAALFVGMAFGKHKLNERVSPKKTWEGAIGGWFFGCVLSFGFAYAFLINGSEHLLFYVFASLTLPIVAQIGDLSFSLIKRNYGAKDFGSLIPGHGGVLDRVDSLLFCLIYFAAMVVVLI